jgi:hypothetical protein
VVQLPEPEERIFTVSVDVWLANNLSAGNDLTFRAGETKNRGSCRSSSCPCFVSCDSS